MLDGLYEEFLDHIIADKGRSPGTVDQYHRWLKRYRAFCSGLGKEPQGIEHRDVSRFMGNLRKQNFSADYVSHAISCLDGFHRWMMIRRYAEANPWTLVERPPRPRKHPKHLPSPEIIMKLLTAFDQPDPRHIRNRAILAVMYGGGCRPIEVCTLTQKNMHLDEGYMWVYGKARGKELRKVAIPEFTVASIKAYLRWARSYYVTRSSPHNVFLRKHGQAFIRQAINSVVHEACDIIGIEHMTPYTLRHSFATHTLKNGIDLESLRELMGHKSLATTEVYLHLEDEYVMAQHKKFHPLSRERRLANYG